MTPAAFRKLALSFDGAVEQAHGGHPDFRAGGKVFASMGYPNKESGVVKLTPEQQEMLVAAEPAIFAAVNGTWGLRGYTKVSLPAADARTMKSALSMAWKNVTSAAPSQRAAKPDGPESPRSRTRPAKRG
jgi:hypothetical protein